MGREIVRQEAPLNPEKRSRLWYYKDVLEVLHKNLGSNNVQGIMIDPPQEEKVKWSGITFEKMNNLRILIVRNIKFSTGPTYLPNSLRWLEWEEYPSITLPPDFSPLELVFLSLPRSHFRLKEPFQSFANHVTYMDFSKNEFITEIPDISQLQSLRRLDLKNCDNLIKIHDSVGSLFKLVKLNLSRCPKLSDFPREIKMPSLEQLYLGSCWSLEYFPHVVGKMDALRYIDISDTAIKELPPSAGNLSRLQSFNMHSCASLIQLRTSLLMLPNLQRLSFGFTHSLKLRQDIQPIISYSMKQLRLERSNLLDEELHLILNCYPNLQELDLSENKFMSLPKCIKECAQLQRLDVNKCTRLRDIPELPSKLRHINAKNCTSLTAESLDNLCSQAKKELPELHIAMPATLPDWLDYCCEGGKLSFRARGNLFPTAALAFQLAKANTYSNSDSSLLVSMSINGRKIIHFHDWKFYANQGHVLLLDLFTLIMRTKQELIESMFKGLGWKNVEIHVTSEFQDISIERCGVYVYKQQTNMEDVQFKSSRASLKRRAKASPPNYEPPNKLLRTNKGKVRNTKKGSR